MGDMGDLFNDLRAQRRHTKALESPRAIENAKRRLEAQGCTVTTQDAYSLRVTKGKFSVHYWPHSGYFQGSAKGYGARRLSAALAAASTDKEKP